MRLFKDKKKDKKAEELAVKVEESHAEIESQKAINQRLLRELVLAQRGEREANDLRLVAENEVERIQSLHSTRVRLGSAVVDPIMMTMRIRAVEPSLRVEYDGTKLVLYGDRALTLPEMNQVEEQFRWEFDQT